MRALRAVAGARRGEAARAQARLLTGEGPRIVEIAAEPISGGPFAIEDPPAVVITLRDVTEQAIAMQLKTDFVANASHELRTPLASIRTAAETMMEIGNESPAMQAKLATMISSNAERLEELARDLLDLSRLESPETECEIVRTDLRDIASGLSELFATSCAKRGIELAFEIDPDQTHIWTDEKLIRLVLRNLIDNAIKFAYEGTAVRVVASRVPAEAASGNGVRPGTGRATLRLKIIDRGIGIPPAPAAAGVRAVLPGGRGPHRLTTPAGHGARAGDRQARVARAQRDHPRRVGLAAGHDDDRGPPRLPRAARTQRRRRHPGLRFCILTGPSPLDRRDLHTPKLPEPLCDQLQELLLAGRIAEPPDGAGQRHGDGVAAAPLILAGRHQKPRLVPGGAEAELDPVLGGTEHGDPDQFCAA
ncbi:MAG: hypothetical protein HND58_17940 [Planctomycetota bacterium]|nr:MAG: hypothetical protein HND58_17940 [Planctomycetota bacterium]